jgi:hypothetical protein
MPRRYDLLDRDTGNLVGRFASEDEALAFVRALIETNGEDVAETIVLGGRDDHGHVLPVESGAALARRAMVSTPNPLPVIGRV